MSLESSRELPFAYFQATTELKYFPLYFGGSTVLMGCSLPVIDFHYSKYIERWWTNAQNQDPQGLWERAEWSMPMRYLGGVVGFAWGVSVWPFPFFRLMNRD
jgi:hypothetical protein